MTESGITPPIGGLTDKCGICSTDVDSKEEIGGVGLNGVLCSSCMLNINLYTPRWITIYGSEISLDVWEFHYTKTPFDSSAVGLVLLEAAGFGSAEPDSLRKVYQSLHADTREFLYSVVAHSLPDEYSTVATDEIDAQPQVVDRNPQKDFDETNPFPMIKKRLGRPFALDGGRLVANFHNSSLDETEVRDMLSATATEQCDIRNEPIIAQAEASEQHSTESDCRDGVADESSQTSDQQSLDVFG